MTDLREPHQCVVGFSGDPKTTEIEILGSKFLVIPFGLSQSQIINSKDYIDTYATDTGEAMRITAAVRKLNTRFATRSVCIYNALDRLSTA